jgi:hypothetical protein
MAMITIIAANRRRRNGHEARRRKAVVSNGFGGTRIAFVIELLPFAKCQIGVGIV